MTLRINAFGGGVVLNGTPDQRLISEVASADGFDIQTRGALTATATITPYANVLDFNGATFSKVLGLLPVSGTTFSDVAVVGQGSGDGANDAYIFAQIDRDAGSSPPYTYGFVVGSFFGPLPLVPMASGAIITGVVFSGTYDVRFLPAATSQVQLYLVNIGAREGVAPIAAPGLYVLVSVPLSTPLTPYRIAQFDALGTGPSGEYAVDSGLVGTNSQQLRFRGIVGYNNHVFGWGFDAEDTSANDGPCRVMFCNLGNPLKWGNDNQAAEGTDRAFTDSDAIVLGSAGELVRAGIVFAGRCYFGTNRGLHFIAGYGRDSFLTDGSTPVMKAFNVVGPYALVEGPDRLLYGVSDNGLWSYDGSGLPTPLFEKLVDLNGFSNGYWDLLWLDPSQPATYPGRTNKDLTWTAVDWERQQVLVGIPFCDATLGYGQGTDTVVIKYHPRTGGFTRQVFEGVELTAVGYFREEGQERATRLLGTATSGETNVQRYGYQATDTTPPALPGVLPVVAAGPYALFSPDGAGTVPRAYLTLSWATGALPLVFAVLVTVDGVTVSDFTLTVSSTAPVAPVDGDIWVDTSETNTSIGNATAVPGIPADRGFLAFLRNADAWTHLAGLGATGVRQTIPIPLARKPGTRIAVTVTCTAAAGRFTVEGLGWKPGTGEEAA